MMSAKNERAARYPYLKWAKPSDAPNRSDSPQRTYYFIDFGLAVHSEDRNCKVAVLGNEGHDRDPSELSTGNWIPYDPYKLDVYLIGNVFRRVLLDVGSQPYSSLTGY